MSWREMNGGVIFDEARKGIMKQRTEAPALADA